MILVPGLSRWFRTTRSQLTLLFGATAVITGLAIGVVADRVLSRHLTQLSGQSLLNASQPIALALAQGMQEREREIALLSHLPLLTGADGFSPQLQAHLEQIQQSYPFYSWIGVTDEQGVVQVATGNLLLRQNVSTRPWFSAAKTGPYVGDAHEAVLLDRFLRPQGSSEPLRFMDYASPIRRQDSGFAGVLAAHVNWAWVQDTIQRASPSTFRDSGMEVMLVNTQGVLNSSGAIELPSTSLPRLPELGAFGVIAWRDSTDSSYLTGVVAVPSFTSTDLQWLLVTRQPLELALQPINRLHTIVAVLLVVMTVLLAATAYWTARRFSRPVENLARAARKIEATGQVVGLDFKVETVEFLGLKSALQRMAQGLIDGKEALAKANAELENRVMERTLALQHSERRYLSILEDQEEIICRFDAEGRLTFLNDAFCRFFGLVREQALGQAWSPVVYPEDLPRVQERLQSVSPGKSLVELENRVVAANGLIRWCHFNNRAFFDDDGDLVEWQTVGRDITDRRTLEIELAKVSERFQDLYDNAPCGYYGFDQNGKYVHINNLTLSWLGMERDAVVGVLGPGDFFDDEGKILFAQTLPVLLQHGHSEPQEFNLIGRDGMHRRVSVSSTAIRDAEGAYVMSRSIMYDVTELHAARQKLHDLNLELEAMLDNDMIGIAKVRDRIIVWRNKALERMFGHAPGALQGVSTEEIYMSDDDFRAFGKEAYPVLQSGRHVRQQHRMRKLNGEEIWIDANGVNLPTPGESLWLMQDITAMKRYQQQVEHIAFHDSLTGLPNRLLLADRMTQAFALCSRTGSKAAICYMDLNGFKPVNDQYGHDMGDEVLRVTGQRLQGQLRVNDTAARIGGDEFVLLLTGISDATEISPLLARVLQAIEEPIDLGSGRVVGISSAIGVAVYPRDGTTAEDLMRKADEAMYTDKGHVSAERSGSVPE